MVAFGSSAKKYFCRTYSPDTSLECVWVSIKHKAGLIIIGAFYRPPDMDNTFSREFQRLLEIITLRFPKSVVLIFGDFNLPGIDWANLSTATYLSEAQFPAVMSRLFFNTAYHPSHAIFGYIH